MIVGMSRFDDAQCGTLIAHEGKRQGRRVGIPAGNFPLREFHGGSVLCWSVLTCYLGRQFGYHRATELSVARFERWPFDGRLEQVRMEGLTGWKKRVARRQLREEGKCHSSIRSRKSSEG